MTFQVKTKQRSARTKISFVNICKKKMGSPELPSEENNIARPMASSLPMHGENATGSDDSDAENGDGSYGGYEPLALDEETMEYRNANTGQDNENDDDDDGDDHYDYSVCVDFFHGFVRHILNFDGNVVSGFQRTNCCP